MKLNSSSYAIVGALAIVVSCTDIVTVDWNKVGETDAAGGGEGGEGGIGGEGGVGGEGGGAPGGAGSGAEGGEAGSSMGGSGGNAGTGGTAGGAGSGGTAGAGKGGSAGVSGSSGSAGAAGSSGSAGSSGAGGSSGQGGTSGAGGGGPCGDGMVAGEEVCDLPFTVNDCGGDCLPITTDACLMCEELNAECLTVVNCSSVAGNAAMGPAQGTARSHLCNETLDCLRDSNCAAGQLIDCYCGTATAAQCDGGQGNGVCRPQLERGYETTSPAEITARFTEITYGSGFAMLRAGCDQAFCTAECFF